MNRFLIIHSVKETYPRDSYLDYIEMNMNPEEGTYLHSSNADENMWYRIGSKLYNPSKDVLKFKMRADTAETLNDILSSQYGKDISEIDCIIFCVTMPHDY